MTYIFGKYMWAWFNCAQGDLCKAAQCGVKLDK